jgi:hypothetical protein
MPDDRDPAGAATPYTYREPVLDELARHGLCPRPTTPPDRLREAVSDLYRCEIRVAKADLLAGRIERANYARHIVELRRRYWLLSIPTALWTDPPPGEGSPEGRGDRTTDGEG